MAGEAYDKALKRFNERASDPEQAIRDAEHDARVEAERAKERAWEKDFDKARVARQIERQNQRVCKHTSPPQMLEALPDGTMRIRCPDCGAEGVQKREKA